MARNDWFLDTSGLYALIDRRDALHVAARRAVEKQVRAGGRLIVTDGVVSEAATLARMRGGAIVALRILDLIEQSVGIRLEWIDPRRFDATKEFFRKHADHRYSFVDCSSFVVMRELGLTSAVTNDRHFVDAGFKALLTSSRQREN